jgi:rubrerythrin
MGNIFAASEIVELGIQIERNGRDFYAALAAKSKNQEARDIFRYLSGEEEKHIQVFQKILDSLEKYEPAQIYSEEYSAYMNALASEHVFTQENKGKEAAKNINTEKEAISFGIKMEQESIIFYEGMKKVVEASDYQAIDELIVQEQNHFRQLFNLKIKA